MINLYTLTDVEICLQAPNFFNLVPKPRYVCLFQLNYFFSLYKICLLLFLRYKVLGTSSHLLQRWQWVDSQRWLETQLAKWLSQWQDSVSEHMKFKSVLCPNNKFLHDTNWKIFETSNIKSTNIQRLYEIVIKLL